MVRVASKSAAQTARKRGDADAPPTFIEPCDPSPHKHPPTGGGWLHEIKFDGYRIQLRLHDGRVTLLSRQRLDWTGQFASIAQAGKTIRADNAIIDGEIAVSGKSGVPDFQALRREVGKASSSAIFHAFDLLWLDGEDLRALPLSERKARLEKLLKKAPPQIVYVEALKGDGAAIFKEACKLGLEGLVSKQARSRYASGRSETWIKSKCTTADNFPIIAFVEKLGAKPRRIASLYIGRWHGKQLLYAGKVQTGFKGESLRAIREALDPYVIKRSPLSVPVKKPKATWVEPVVQAEVKYTGVTDDGILREAVFKGLRDDLSPPTIKAPAIVPGRRGDKVGVPRENILQLLPDAVAPTKAQLEAYWCKVGKKALKYLARRPLKLVRHTHSTTFYHKGPLPPVTDSVHQLRIEKREGGHGVRLWVDDVPGLLGLVSMGAVELHAWNATVDDIEYADQLVFDLDPGAGVEWDFVTDTALELRALLKGEGFDSWPKVTGGKGIHVMVPIAPELTHDQAHRYSQRMAERLAATKPGRYTTSAAIGHRAGKLFIDYLRNGRGTTAVGTYSPRVREGFPIAAPVTWQQVERGIAADAYTMAQPFRAARR